MNTTPLTLFFAMAFVPAPGLKTTARNKFNGRRDDRQESSCNVLDCDTQACAVYHCQFDNVECDEARVLESNAERLEELVFPQYELIPGVECHPGPCDGSFSFSGSHWFCVDEGAEDFTYDRRDCVTAASLRQQSHGLTMFLKNKNLHPFVGAALGNSSTALPEPRMSQSLAMAGGEKQISTVACAPFDCDNIDCAEFSCVASIGVCVDIRVRQDDAEQYWEHRQEGTNSDFVCHQSACPSTYDFANVSWQCAKNAGFKIMNRMSD